MSLGEKLKHFRKERRMKQKQLAETSGITQATLSRIESGKVHEVKSETLKRLAQVLGIAMEDLVDFEISESEKEKGEIDRVFDFIIRDPNFKYGTRLTTEELTTEAKRFLIELYEKATDRRLLRRDSENAK